MCDVIGSSRDTHFAQSFRIIKYSRIRSAARSIVIIRAPAISIILRSVFITFGTGLICIWYHTEVFENNGEKYSTNNKQLIILSWNKIIRINCELIYKRCFGGRWRICNTDSARPPYTYPCNVFIQTWFDWVAELSHFHINICEGYIIMLAGTYFSLKMQFA